MPVSRSLPVTRSQHRVGYNNYASEIRSIVLPLRAAGRIVPQPEAAARQRYLAGLIVLSKSVSSLTINGYFLHGVRYGFCEGL